MQKHWPLVSLQSHENVKPQQSWEVYRAQSLMISLKVQTLGWVVAFQNKARASDNPFSSSYFYCWKHTQKEEYGFTNEHMIQWVWNRQSATNNQFCSFRWVINRYAPSRESIYSELVMLCLKAAPVLSSNNHYQVLGAKQKWYICNLLFYRKLVLSLSDNLSASLCQGTHSVKRINSSNTCCKHYCSFYYTYLLFMVLFTALVIHFTLQKKD